MSQFWPDEPGFEDVFSEGDPCPGEVISDKYGLVSYSPQFAIATTLPLSSTGLTGLDLLKLRDPEEHQRVQRLARRRAEVLRRVYNAPADAPAHKLLR